MNVDRFAGGDLDPRIDPDRWERVVRSVVAAARPELKRLAARRPALALLTEWRRPVLAVAASIILVAGVTLALRRGQPPAAETELPVVAEAIASSTIAAWLLAEQAPTMEELLVSLNGETR